MLSLVAAALLASAGPPVLIDSPAGPIEGTADGRITVFRGIPYAVPPVGPLRWRAPQPLPRWKTRFAAHDFGHVCMQVPPKGDAGVGIESPSEDCLTLNIWAPKGARRLPVMVWLHGGGYTSGSGSAALYDGRTLAARGVVLITLNYRLGRFGFFDHPQLDRSEGANFGLLDQRAALRWVRDNIASFGGDPLRVTLFGNSAGGESVLFHMTSAKSRGLFHRAIVQSGLGGRSLRHTGSTIDQDRVATRIADLRAIPAANILSWGAPSIYRGFGPTIDGVSITQTIEATFRAHKQARMPLIIGYNGLEIPPSAVGGAAGVMALVGHDEADRNRAIAAYGSAAAYEERIASDLLFRAPALRLARLHAAAGAPTWAYEFDVLSSAAAARLKGAPHASERAYIFGTLPTLGWPTDDRDTAIALSLGDAWVRFARSRALAPPMTDWGRSTARDARARLFTRATSRPDMPVSSALAQYLGLQ